MWRSGWLAGLLALGLACGPGQAAPCAPPGWSEARADLRAALLGQLASAASEAEGRAAEEALWQLWSAAPGDAAQALLDRVHDRRRWYDLAAAEAAARALTRLCPDYAEGWNQLATVLFQRGEGEAALAAIAETLAREPAHFGALSGRALILLGQGRGAAAQAALRAAVALHPWLRERHLLAPAPK
ncbi:hypothetical protein LNKW23_06570 [Paralimibaculum aggregatum]|uniref:Tetratricopeptide repeat protein n=1 Tax=Paralimibaculum aggregatum TaxID=3036245 RepID=A0ABQ6LH58_9RHOB|nr:hypothetical protein [Limibaculum sp. NKW23]GMG81444.1 hypothetical protein LNKW23_06570 [Limibaculum sp. NKW23]